GQKPCRRAGLCRDGVDWFSNKICRTCAFKRQLDVMNEIFSAFYYKKRDEFLICTRPIKAIVYYQDFQINLITGKRKNTGISELWDFLEDIPLDKSMAHPIVVHLCFEAGYEFVGLDSMVPQHEPLAYILWYEKTEFIKRED